MDIHLRELLISLKYTDFSFDNPLELRHEADGPVIGKAELCKKKDRLLVDLLIQTHLDYLPLFPRLAVDAINRKIGYVFLSKLQPIDPEVLIIRKQVNK
jgi:hypothetical protein